MLALGEGAGLQNAEPFQGELSQVNIFSSAFQQLDIEALASNCSEEDLPMGDIFAWPIAEAFLEGDVTVLSPSTCEGTECPPGYEGTLCSQAIGKKNDHHERIIFFFFLKI